MSSDRANASRRELLLGGLPEYRMLRVQGLASSALFDRNDPLSPTNRRISIIVMNREAEDRFFQTTPLMPEPEAPAAEAATTPPSTSAAAAR